jgi:hypothetical protein
VNWQTLAAVVPSGGGTPRVVILSQPVAAEHSASLWRPVVRNAFGHCDAGLELETKRVAVCEMIDSVFAHWCVCVSVFLSVVVCVCVCVFVFVCLCV